MKKTVDVREDVIIAGTEQNGWKFTADDIFVLITLCIISEARKRCPDYVECTTNDAFVFPNEAACMKKKRELMEGKQCKEE